jgi:hypothetical protein
MGQMEHREKIGTADASGERGIVHTAFEYLIAAGK